MYLQMNFMLSVLPAPLSPLMMKAWLSPCGNEGEVRTALVEGLVVVEGGVIVEALELLERIDSHQYTANACLEENEEQEKEEEKTKDIS